MVNALQQRVSTSVRRQRRSGNGEPASAADRLWRQCARHVDGQGHDRHADEICEDAMSVSGIGCTVRRCMIQSLRRHAQRSSTICSASSAPARRPTPMPASALDRGLTRRPALAAFRDRPATATPSRHVDVRLDLAQTALSRISDISARNRRRHQRLDLGRRHARQPQIAAHASLGEMLGLLNTQAGDRYLFSGRHPTSRRSRRSTTFSTATARAPASSRSSPSASRPISAPAASAASSSSAPTRDIGAARRGCAVSPFGFKLAAISSTIDRVRP